MRPIIQDQYIIIIKSSKSGRYAKENPAGYDLFGRGQYQVKSILTKGKFMYWQMGNIYLLCSFGMSGQWSPQRGKHPCFEIHYSHNPDYGQGEYCDNSLKALYFNDPRHFGTIRFTDKKEVVQAKLDSLGWDPFQEPKMPDDNLAFQDFCNRFYKKSNKTLAEILLDQSLFCGCGNYLKSDLCWMSKINPLREKNSISKDELYLLCNNLVLLMNEAYNCGGTTILTYADPYGNKGNYKTKAYNRKIDDNGEKIDKVKTKDGRSTYFVATRQK